VKVRFRQSGGFSGLLRGCDLDTEVMDRHESKELEALVAAGVSAEQGPVEESLRDGIRYEITVEGEGGIRRLRYEDPAIPGPAVPLLSFLRERSGPLKV